MDMNEAYLDNLLKSMEQKEAAQPEPEAEPEAPEAAPSVSDVQNMSEEEIARLLQESAVAKPEKKEPMQEEDFPLDADLPIEDELGPDEALPIEDELGLGEDLPMEDKKGLDDLETDSEQLKAGEDPSVGMENLQEEQEKEEQEEGRKKKRNKSGEKFSLAGLFKRKEKIPAEALDIPAEGENQTAEVQDVSEQSTEEPGEMQQGTDPENKAEGKKKTGFFKRFLEFLQEEDEDEDAAGKPKTETEAAAGNEGQLLNGASEENKEALEQLAKEDQEQKKKKKKKDKKQKKAAKAGETQEESEDSKEAEEDSKKEKTKKDKPEKKKKEKDQEESKTDDSQLVKIPKKNLRATVLFSVTIIAAVILCCLFVPELFELKSARNAYYNGDYEKCFRTFYGKNLSENDRIMYEHSVMQLLIGRKEEAYQSYVAVGEELRALDVLLQAVKEQDALLEEAEKYGLADTEREQYSRILSILSEKYGVNEETAKEINAYTEDAVYTLRLKSIVEKTPFELPDYINAEEYGAVTVPGDGDNAAGTENTEQDLLPAEEELPDTSFTDNTN